MADNTTLDSGAGGDVIATDDVTDAGVANGAKVQRVKAGFGTDNAYADPTGGTGVDGPGVARVSLATDIPLPAGTNNIGDVDVLSSALPTGAATEATLAGDLDLAASHARNEAFKEAIGIGGEMDDTATVVATEGNVSPVRITAQRGLHVNLRSSIGTEIGDATTPLVASLVDSNGTELLFSTDGVAALPEGIQIQGTDGTLAQTISTNSTGHVNIADGGNIITVDGTITANAGSNLNTSALALDATLAGVIGTDGGVGPANTVSIGGTEAGGNIQEVLVDAAGHLQVDVLSGGGGGQQYAEDTLHVTGDTLTLAGVVQQSSDAALSGDGDRSLLQVDATGYLKVNVKAGGGTGGTSQADNSVVTTITGIGCLYDVTPPAITDGNVGLPLMTSGRILRTILEPNAGIDVGDVTINNTAGANAVRVQGNAADGVAVSGDPVRIGGKDISGNTQDVATSTTGAVAVMFADTPGDAVADASFGFMGEGDGSSTAPIVGCYAWGGSSWNRLRSAIATGLEVDVIQSNLDATDAGAHGVSQLGIRAMGSDGTNDRQIAVDATGNVQVDIVADGAGLALAANQLADGHAVTVDNLVGNAVFSRITDGVETANVTAANRLAVDVEASVLPTGAATSAGQLADGHNVTVDNVAGTNPVPVHGTGAHGAALSGNPVMLGATSEDAADAAPANRITTEGQMGRLSQNGDGALYVIPSGPQQWNTHLDGSTAYTDQSIHASPGAGLSLYVTDIICSTGAATAMNIFFEEATTTVLGPYYLEAVAGRGLALHFNTPKKITAATALTVTTSASIAQSIDVHGFIAPG